MLARVYKIASNVLEMSNRIIGNVLSKNDVVLVTGGCSGLGQEIVSSFLRRGYQNIVVFDIHIDNKVKFKGVHYYECDISDYEQILQVQQLIKKDVGVVSCIINNAGTMIGKPLITMKVSEIDSQIKVNLISNFYMIRVFLADMIAIKKGYIVTIASVLGFMSPANLTVYGASKAGQIAMHEALANELRYYSDNVKMLLICPGKLKTPMFEHVKNPSHVLAPELDPCFLADKIISFCEVGKRGDYKTPFYCNFIPLFKSLPWPFVRVFRILSGIDKTMIDYASTMIEPTKQTPP